MSTVLQRTPYEIQGRRTAPAIVVLGGISAGRHVSAHAADPRRGWWEGIVGAACAIDPADYCVFGIDYPGTSLRAEDAPQRLSTHDQARALADVLDDASIEQVRAIVGSSYGGMVALAFASLFPHRVERIVLFGAAHRPHPMATALRSIQRQIVIDAAAAGTPQHGIALARTLAMTTYRTAEEFAARFDDSSDLAAWLQHHGDVFAASWTPARFLTLSQSIDLHDVDPTTITAHTTLTSFTGDAIAPPWQVRELAGLIAGEVVLHEIESEYGHDAFLKETGIVANIITGALQSGAEQ